MDKESKCQNVSTFNSVQSSQFRRTSLEEPIQNNQDFLLIPKSFAWQKPLDHSYQMDKNHTVLAI